MRWKGWRRLMLPWVEGWRCVNGSTERGREAGWVRSSSRMCWRRPPARWGSGLEDLNVVERIVDGDAEASEVVDVSGRDAEVLRLGDGEDQQISQVDRSAAAVARQIHREQKRTQGPRT